MVKAPRPHGKFFAYGPPKVLRSVEHLGDQLGASNSDTDRVQHLVGVGPARVFAVGGCDGLWHAVLHPLRRPQTAPVERNDIVRCSTQRGLSLDAKIGYRDRVIFENHGPLVIADHPGDVAPSVAMIAATAALAVVER
jgi:hypothetical protein